MDYMKGGSLSELISLEERGLTPKNYDNTKRQIILIGISHGMKHLHQLHIIHHDLKPENILLDEDIQPRITINKLNEFITKEDPDGIIYSFSYECNPHGNKCILSLSVIEIENEDGNGSGDGNINGDEEPGDGPKGGEECKKLSAGEITGIVIGCLVAVAIVIGFVIFFIKRKKSTKSSTEENEVEDQ